MPGAPPCGVDGGSVDAGPCGPIPAPDLEPGEGLGHGRGTLYATSSNDRGRAALRRARQDWAAISRALSRYAFTRTGTRSWSLAEELAQQAICKVLEPSYRAR